VIHDHIGERLFAYHWSEHFASEVA